MITPQRMIPGAYFNSDPRPLQAFQCHLVFPVGGLWTSPWMFQLGPVLWRSHWASCTCRNGVQTSQKCLSGSSDESRWRKMRRMTMGTYGSTWQVPLSPWKSQLWENPWKSLVIIYIINGWFLIARLKYWEGYPSDEVVNFVGWLTEGRLIQPWLNNDRSIDR